MTGESLQRVRAAVCALALLALPFAEGAAAEGAAAAGPSLTVAPSGAALAGAPLHLDLTLDSIPAGAELPVVLTLDGVEVEAVTLGLGTHEVRLEDEILAPGRHEIRATVPGADAAASFRTIPGWTSILPPLIAIGLALLTKNVLIALSLGIFAGALLLNGHPITAFQRTIDQFIAPSMADPNQSKILIFSSLLAAMVGVIGKSGGTQGIVDWLRPLAKNPQRGQLATWLLGVMIFFDDYANTLIVGSTMRPVTDRLKISREKLAYIVDSTAAPVVAIIPISTWIGFEVGLVAGAFEQMGLDLNAYTTVVASIPYRFYPLFALILGFSVATSGRDWGPMLAAERRARTTGDLLASGDVALSDYGAETLEPPAGKPRRPINAILPILTVVTVTIVGLLDSGADALGSRPAGQSTLQRLQDLFTNGDSFNALLWASLSGATMAIALSIGQRILKVREAMDAAVEGIKSILLALLVLILAWSIGAVCTELHTADYLVQLATGVVSPHMLPALIFIVAAAVAFATGTSWGTMGILTPLIIPVGHGLSLAAGYEFGSSDYQILLLGAVSSVLAGSVWGDHCSPISDTTILSSMAAGSDHIAHVRTQMPYALTIGFIGILIGDIPTAYGMSPWISVLVGATIIVVGLRVVGRKSAHG